jgi:hypothetical protein
VFSDPGAILNSGLEFGGFFGFCSGTSAPYDYIGATTNAVGMRVDWPASGYVAGSLQPWTVAPLTRVGTTPTLGSNASGAARFAASGFRGLYSIEVVRVAAGGGTSGNYSVAFALADGTKSVDASDFHLGFLSEYLPATTTAVGPIVRSGVATLAVNEPTNGYLNHLQILWGTNICDMFVDSVNLFLTYD